MEWIKYVYICEKVMLFRSVSDFLYKMLELVEEI